MKIWDSLWVDATIATCNEHSNDYGLLSHGALAIKDGKIAWVGSYENLPDDPKKLADVVRSLAGRCITPGLIDCHTHLVYAGTRSHEFSMRLHGATYQQIAQAGGGILATVQATRDASHKELYLQSAKRLQNMLQNGVTTVEIKSGYGLNQAAEIKQLEVIKNLSENFPLTLCPTFLGAHALPPEYSDQKDAYVDFICHEMIPIIAEAKLATAVDAFCETIGFTIQQVEKIFLAAKQWNLSVKLHAEQLSDSKGALLATQYKALSVDHLEYLQDEDIKALANSKTVVVLLPGAFYFLRETKFPPIKKLREYKVPIAIATDCNPGTSPTTSLPLMMNMACVLWRFTPEESLRGVTINATKALGLTSQYGSLEIGKMADFVVWDLDHPDQLCYQFGLHFNKEVIKHGKIVFSDISGDHA